MRLAFIDIAASYHAASPYEKFLGGTQSATCYLAAALARRGVSVTLINQNRQEGTWLGVANLAPERLDGGAALQPFDVLAVSGRWTKKLVVTLKQRHPRARLVAWMHEAAFNDPWILPLPEFSAFIFGSEWQRRANAPLIPAHAKSRVMNLAIAPAFAGLFPPDTAILAAKPGPPLAIYAGASRRGLLDLPHIIPLLHEAAPDLVFEIYCDCVTGKDEKGDPALQEKLRALPGTRHVGTLPQEEFVRRFKAAQFFLSPNNYPETFCIVLAEALASGLTCIITSRAALPQTASGFAELVPVPEPDNMNYLETSLDIPAFAAAAAKRICAELGRPQETREADLRRQVDFANARYCWDKRAEEWIKFLSF